MIKRVTTRLNFAPEIYFPRKLQTQWRLPIGSLHQTLCSIQTTYQKTLTLARILSHAHTFCAHAKTLRAHPIYICAPSQPMQLQTIHRTTWLSLSVSLSLHSRRTQTTQSFTFGSREGTVVHSLHPKVRVTRIRKKGIKGACLAIADQNHFPTHSDHFSLYKWTNTSSEPSTFVSTIWSQYHL